MPRSKTWRELLAEKYGKNRWYLNVDVDEFLFTGNNSKMTIGQYAKLLYKQGILRLPAPMIDMVPGQNLSEAILTDDVKPWEISSYFDLDSYHGYSKSGGIKLYGGARKRLWNADAELIKYPSNLLGQTYFNGGLRSFTVTHLSKPSTSLWSSITFQNFFRY